MITVSEPSPEPPPDHQSTAVNHRRTTGQRWPTTVNGGAPPKVQRRTTGQRWLNASQRAGQRLPRGQIQLKPMPRIKLETMRLEPQ
ncbi:hypothetical protein Tco_1059890, partial [Tanacetum coccineum]